MQAVKRKRLLTILQRGHHLRKLLAASHSGGVVRAQAGLVDAQGALVEGAGVVKATLSTQDIGEMAQVVSNDRVVGA
jgi:hypothetical protein